MSTARPSHSPAEERLRRLDARLAAVAEQNLIECLNRGWGGKDMTAAWALQEDRAHVQVRATSGATASSA